MKDRFYDSPQDLYPIASHQNFDETAYLKANPDVAAAFNAGQLESGYQHFDIFGQQEGRHLLVEVDVQRKQLKLDRLRPLLRQDMRMVEETNYFDCLTPELREEFNIIDTHAVSSNEYNSDMLSLIKEHKDGLILDCGAGSRKQYYQNVVNFEIAAYPSTDVIGVGEQLPFKDNVFDAVISNVVLEHVKYPWLCAEEIMRVLKPGGDLICSVPFLQPVHGYPHHYYNMTELGLRNLFCSGIDIIRHEIHRLPIHSLTWILNSWAEGLDETVRQEFINLRVADLMKQPETYLSENFVTMLSKEKNMELASATIIYGKKI
jgi:SAM-dependent methyltransferase